MTQSENKLKKLGRPYKKETEMLFRQEMLSKNDLPMLNKEIIISPRSVKGSSVKTVYQGILTEEYPSLFLFIADTLGHSRECFKKSDFEKGILLYEYKFIQ